MKNMTIQELKEAISSNYEMIDKFYSQQRPQLAAGVEKANLKLEIKLKEKEQVLSQALNLDQLCDQLYKLKERIKLAQQLEKEISKKLKDITENKDVVTEHYIYAKSIRKGSIDYSQILVLKTMDLEPYRKKEIETWSLKKIDKE